MKTCCWAAAVLLQLLWAGDSRASLVVLDPRATVLSIAQNDRLWARHLDVYVQVDKELLTPAALSVVELAQAARPPPSVTAATIADAAAAPATKTAVNALVVVVEVACGDRQESDRYDFALAVAASAIKCRVLPYVLVQALAMGRERAFPSAANYKRPRIVWRTLSRYLNKMGRMRESLYTGSGIYRLWEVVVKQTLAPSPSNQSGALGDVQPFVSLVVDVVEAGCAPETVAGVFAELNAPQGPRSWKSAQATTAAFDRAQLALDTLLDDLPIVAMEQGVWEVFLNGTGHGDGDHGAEGGGGAGAKGKGV